jgi:hypothetical protein
MLEINEILQRVDSEYKPEEVGFISNIDEPYNTNFDDKSLLASSNNFRLTSKPIWQ